MHGGHLTLQQVNCCHSPNCCQYTLLGHTSYKFEPGSKTGLSSATCPMRHLPCTAPETPCRCRWLLLAHPGCVPAQPPHTACSTTWTKHNTGHTTCRHQHSTTWFMACTSSHVPTATGINQHAVICNAAVCYCSRQAAIAPSAAALTA